MGSFKWLLLLLIVLTAFLAWYCRPKPPTSTIRLELESFGGFAYVHTPSEHKVEIAYLKDALVQEPDPATNQPRTVCEVDQLGVDLLVVSGVIESTPAPANRMFDLAGAVVTFPDLEAHATTLVVNRGNRPTAAPFGPANPGNVADWADLKFVPGTIYAQSTTDYPASSLNPNWRSLVDGRVVLTHGEITAINPSDVAVRDSIFEFKSNSGTQAAFKQAMTDRTVFRADVPADRIVIHLTGATETKVNPIIIRPVTPGRPVKLKLIGRHVHQTPPVLPVNAAVEHYCAFYQLLQPIPQAKDQLIPYLFSGPPAASAGGQPSPGALCPPDWF